MTPPPKALTDSGLQRAIADAASLGAEKALEMSKTPPIGSAQMQQDSSEHIRQIARDEAERTVRSMVAEHKSECINEGPVCGVWEEIGKMRTQNGERDKLIAEFVGAQRLARWLVPIGTSLLTSAVAVALLKLAFAGAIGK